MKVERSFNPFKAKEKSRFFGSFEEAFRCILSEKDKQAIGVLSFCDVTEAIMSVEREYQKEETNDERRDWNVDKVVNQGTKDEKRIPSACTIVKGNASLSVPYYLKDEGVELRMLDERYGELAADKAFQKRFDLVQELPLERMVRNYVAEYARDYEVTLSTDKVEDIKRDFSLGAAFLVKEETEKGTCFVLDRQEIGKRMEFYPKREEPDFDREESASSLMEESAKETESLGEESFLAVSDGEERDEDLGEILE